MIVSNLEAAELSAIGSAFPWFSLCVKWAKEERVWTKENEDVSEGIYVKKVQYDTSDPTTCRFENHRKELDVQLILEGGEVIELLRSDQVELDGGYEVSGDVQFYRAKNEVVPRRLTMESGDIAVFFPDDVHCCGWTREGVATVRKYVFKIDREHWNLV